jgi:hypothetical protein
MEGDATSVRADSDVQLSGRRSPSLATNTTEVASSVAAGGHTVAASITDPKKREFTIDMASIQIQSLATEDLNHQPYVVNANESRCCNISGGGLVQQKKHRGENLYWKTVENFPSRDASLDYVKRVHERNECRGRVNVNRLETVHYFKCAFHTVGCQWQYRVVIDAENRKDPRYMRQECSSLIHNHSMGGERPQKRGFSSDIRQAVDDAIAKGMKRPLEIIHYLKMEKNIAELPTPTAVANRLSYERRRGHKLLSSKSKQSRNAIPSADDAMLCSNTDVTDVRAIRNDVDVQPTPLEAAAAAPVTVAQQLQPYTVAEMVAASSETLDAAVQSFVEATSQPDAEELLSAGCEPEGAMLVNVDTDISNTALTVFSDR